MTQEQKAAEILKANRAAARVAKARELSPAFDAECRAAEEEAQRLDVSQWTVRQHVMYGLGYAYGWLRGRWAPLVAFITLTWIVVKILPFLWLLAKFLAIMLPVWIITALGGFRRTPYRRRVYRDW